MSYTLAGEDPALTAGIEKLRVLAESDGIQFDVADFGGVRTAADTVRILGYRDADYAVYVAALAKSRPGQKPTPMDVWRPIAPFGLSMHNWGCARDVKILKKPESFSEAEAYRRLGAHAPSCGLKWGGTFKKRVDFPHFELTLSLIDARARWDARHTPV
jgi:hypothetical protein